LNRGFPLFFPRLSWRERIRKKTNKKALERRKRPINKSVKRNFDQCFALEIFNLQFINPTWKKKEEEKQELKFHQQSCKNQKKKSKLLLRSTHIRICWSLSLLRYIAVSGRWGCHKRQLHRNMDLAQLIELNKIKFIQTKS